MAMIQQRSAPGSARAVIAASNVINAIFMVLSAVFLIAQHQIGVPVPYIFGVLALMNAAIALYIYLLIPEFLYRLLCYLLANVSYRLRIEGEDHIPDTGPVLLASNHVTFVDWLLIAGACRRPARFVMHHSFLKLPLRLVFKAPGHSIASGKKRPPC